MLGSIIEKSLDCIELTFSRNMCFKKLYPTVIWKAEFINDEIGHLAEISKQVLKVQMGFFLLTVKWEREEIH